MGILKNEGRQAVSVAVQVFAIGNFAAALTQAAVELPGNAIVTGGFIVVEEAFNAATTAAVSLGDAVVANRYGDAIDLKTTGKKDLTTTGYTNPRVADLILTYAETGATATEGKATLVLEYVELSKSEWTQG